MIPSRLTLHHSFLMPLGKDSYRTGEIAKIVDVVTIVPGEGVVIQKGQESLMVPRVCFRIVFSDGDEDLIAVGEKNKYSLLTNEEVIVSFIKKEQGHVRA